MPQITAIKPQKKGKKINIFLDGKFAFSLSRDSLINLNLKEGQVLQNSEIQKIIKENEIGEILEKVFRFLSYRPRSEQEIKNYLNKKEVGEETQKIILQRLKESNFLDDLEFARWLVRQRSQRKPKGRLFLKNELLQKGVKPELVNEVLKERTPSEEMSHAESLAKKKLVQLKGQGYLEKKQKLFSYLSRRGFDFETITQAIDKLLKKE